MLARHRDMDLLHPNFRIIADRFISLCVEQKIAILIVETWRSQAAHEEDVANGNSWVTKSKHQTTMIKYIAGSPITIPASEAIDVCPYEIYELHGRKKLEWDNDDPVWQKIGAIGESLGMKWGGRWRCKDMGHFQASWA